MLITGLFAVCQLSGRAWSLRSNTIAQRTSFYRVQLHEQMQFPRFHTPLVYFEVVANYKQELHK